MEIEDNAENVRTYSLICRYGILYVVKGNKEFTVRDSLIYIKKKKGQHLTIELCFSFYSLAYHNHSYLCLSRLPQTEKNA